MPNEFRKLLNVDLVSAAARPHPIRRRARRRRQPPPTGHPTPCRPGALSCPLAHTAGRTAAAAAAISSKSGGPVTSQKPEIPKLRRLPPPPRPSATSPATTPGRHSGGGSSTNLKHIKRVWEGGHEPPRSSEYFPFYCLGNSNNMEKLCWNITHIFWSFINIVKQIKFALKDKKCSCISFFIFLKQFFIFLWAKHALLTSSFCISRMDPSLLNVHCLEWLQEVPCWLSASQTFLSVKNKIYCQSTIYYKNK